MTTPRFRLLPILVALAAAAGLALAVDAIARGSLMKYRLLGAAIGATLCLPALAVVVWRERALRLLRKIAFAATPATLLLVAIELLLRPLGIGARPHFETVVDARLAYRLRPTPPATDGAGWRNPQVLDRADVIVVGDSQTYGQGVALRESYPRVLAVESGLAVYSLSLGGFGPIQYRELVHSGLALHPHAVVVGLYLGNDLFDAHSYAFLDSATDLRRDGVTYPAHRRQPPDPTPPAPNLALRAVDLVLDTSRVLGGASDVVLAALRQRGGYWVAESGALEFAAPGVDTLLTPRYRLRAVDLADPDIAEGARITGRCLADIGQDCRAAGAQPLLLLMHSKEYWYRELARRLGRDVDPELERLHAAEQGATAAVVAATTVAGLEVVDPSTEVLAAIANGTPLWPRGTDGHFAAGGHALLARVLARALAARPRR